MKKLIAIVVFIALAGVCFAQTPDLEIDSRVNVAAMDYANNYLTFKGAVGAVNKDQYVAVDATSGASKLDSTEVFNKYRLDVQNKATMPGGLRGILLYGVADNATRTGDGLSASKANGVITITTVHRGTAYLIVTDNTGKISLPTTFPMRKIGHTDNQISTDFSPTGKVADVDWMKVWDTSIADGKVIGATTSKTGKILPDNVTSSFFFLSGTLQVTFENNILKMNGKLFAKNR